MTQSDYSFRTLNYLGSKFRLLDFIEEQVRRITPKGGGVCDLFAGSGCVSFMLSKDFPVISCDIQAYSKVLCNALLSKHDITEDAVDNFVETVKTWPSLLSKAFFPLIQCEKKAIENKNLSVLTDILEHGSIEVFRLEAVSSSISGVQKQVIDNLRKTDLMNKRSLISRYYGGVYFSYSQAVEIDTILDAIRNIKDNTKRQLFLAALLSTASDVVDTVGKHFAQPIKARDCNGNIKILVYNKAVKDKTIKVLSLFEEWLRKYLALPKNEKEHVAIQCDFTDCLRMLPNNVKTVYADPPYTRDHYSRFYHVLETMALDDEPEISTVRIHGTTHISNGIYRKDRYQSPFCICSKAPEAFKQMFKLISESNRNLLLSYSPYDLTQKTRPRVVTISQLLSWTKDYFTHVEIVSAGHFTHNKLNSTEHLLNASDEAEMLIVCTN